MELLSTTLIAASSSTCCHQVRRHVAGHARGALGSLQHRSTHLSGCIVALAQETMAHRSFTGRRFRPSATELRRTIQLLSATCAVHVQLLMVSGPARQRTLAVRFEWVARRTSSSDPHRKGRYWRADCPWLSCRNFAPPRLSAELERDRMRIRLDDLRTFLVAHPRMALFVPPLTRRLTIHPPEELLLLD
ncbi:hypothetical protein BD414DRAFT_109543 [Trametes punicea]|nr:hypothetical protein BD414DRAFT_109543 [Trametes punicea]